MNFRFFPPGDQGRLPTLTGILSLFALSLILSGIPLGSAHGTGTVPRQNPSLPTASPPPNLQVSFLDPQPGGEPTVGVNAYGTLVADWEEQAAVDNPVGPSGFAISNDSGTTFGTQHIIQVPGASWQYDVSTASTSPNGTMWVGYGACTSGCNGGTLNTEDYVTAIWDNGSKWSQPINTIPASQSASFVDRDWVASTPNGSVYQVVDDATGSTNNVFLGKSYDGTHFQRTQVIYGSNGIPIDAFAFNNTLWGAADLNATNGCTILLSGNGGATWAPAPGTSSGCDNTGGSIAWQVVWGMDHSLDLTFINSSGVWFTQSRDFSTTWSAPVQVSGSPPSGTSFETPTIAASLSSGEVSVVWLDTRTTPGASVPNWFVYEADSYNEGTTWSAVRQLSDTKAGSGSNFWPGDFIGSTLTPWGTSAAVWGEDDTSGYLQTFFGQIPLMDPAAGNVTVHVVNSTGAPISGALVQVSGYGPSRSNASGLVTYYSLAPGSYPVSASKAPYGSGTGSATVTRGTTQFITITLSAITGRPSITAYTALPDPTPVGGTAYLNVSVVGGSPPYSYAYAGLPAGCPTQDTASLVCTPTTAGNFTVTVTVTDRMSHSVSDNATLQVRSPAGMPTITSFTAYPSVIPLGGTTYLNVSVTGGTPPFIYAYSNLPSGCTSSNSPSLPCSPLSSGTYTNSTVTVTDSNGIHVTSSTVTFTVTSGTQSGPVISTFTALPATIPKGGTTYLNVTASGGTSPLSYSYSGLPIGCTSSNLASLPCSPTYPGTYRVNVTVTDATGKTASNSAASFVVTAPAGYPVISSFLASPATLPLGATTTLTTQVSGGAPPYTFSYDGLPAGCVSLNISSTTCTPTTTGIFTISVVVNDSKGQSTSRATVLTVDMSTSRALTVQLTASLNPVPVGDQTLLTVTVTGGSLPYTYTYSGLPSGCTSSNTSSLHCTPSGVGNFSVTVTVTDANGLTGSRYLKLTVRPPSPNNSGGLLGGEDLGILVVVAVALSLIVLLQRRKRAQNRERVATPVALAPALAEGSLRAEAPPEWEETPAGSPEDAPPPSEAGGQWPPPG